MRIIVPTLLNAPVNIQFKTPQERLGMQRAAVLIGVSKSGTLPFLPAVIPSVRAMEAWALEQGMRRELVKTLTDESGPLEPGCIKAAIRDIVDLAIIDQLVVYFAGHGVNIRYGEYWLLSAAPADPQAAVNLSGSDVLARYCGIPHVIFFSDACRTAAEGIQAQYVSGSDIFPNYGSDGLEKSVDLFFACTLGRPAHEIRDPKASASAFQAIYTEALVSALTGQHMEIVVPEGPPPSLSEFGVIRPRKLKEHLRKEVLRKLRALGTATAVYPTAESRPRKARGFPECLIAPSATRHGGNPKCQRLFRMPPMMSFRRSSALMGSLWPCYRIGATAYPGQMSLSSWFRQRLNP